MARDAEELLVEGSGSLPPVLPAVSCPSVAATVPPSTGLRGIHAKGMSLCPGLHVHVQAFKLHVHLLFQIRVLPDGLNTQKKKKKLFFLCVWQRHVSQMTICARAELAVSARK